MSVAVQKLSGVESVNVSLERASTEVQLRPGNSITLEQLRSIVKNNGFTAKEAIVEAVGELIERGGQPALKVSGTNTVMLVVADPNHPLVYKDIQERVNARRETLTRLTGLVHTSADSPDRIAVRAVRDEGR